MLEGKEMLKGKECESLTERRSSSEAQAKPFISGTRCGFCHQEEAWYRASFSPSISAGAAEFAVIVCNKAACFPQKAC